MLRPTLLLLLALTALQVGVLLPTASAQIVVGPFSFSSSSDYDNANSSGPFRDTGGAALINRVDEDAVGSGNGVLRFASANTSALFGVSLYDSDGAAGNGSNNFLNTVVRSDFRIAGSGDSVGFITRAPGATGYLASVTVSGDLDTINLYESNTNASTGALGTLAVTQTAAVLSLNTYYTLQVTTYTLDASMVVLLAEVFMQGTSVAPLLSATYTDTTTPVIGQGRIAYHFQHAANNTSQTDVDNFSISTYVVPEPRTAVTIAGGLLALAGLRRRQD